MSRLTLLLLPVALACADDKLDDTGSATGGDGGMDADGGGDGGEAGGDPYVDVPSLPAIVVSADVTWTLDFDEEGESRGLTDCSYSRTYQATQVLDLDYLCPECSVIVRGTATMVSGLEDCYSQISTDPTTERTELWGWTADGALYRSGRDQYPLAELSGFDDAGEDVIVEIGWESENELTDGGTMILSATGTLSYVTDADTLLAEPFPDRSDVPYVCGWEQNDPGTLTLDYELGVGKTFPNVRLVDQCGEKLALWDLYGSYLVMDTSQSDCGPCRSMASTAEEFAAEMDSEGIPVHVVSFLGNGLSDPFGTPDEDTFTEWVESYGLTDPVLYDRGFAYALFPDFVTEFSGEDFGYPTWLVVDPEMNLVYGNVGFSSWDAVAELIRTDWDGR